MVALSDQPGGLCVTLQRRAYEIFKRATDVPETEIENFLDQECAQNVELRKQVEELLAVEIEARDFLPEDAPPPRGVKQLSRHRNRLRIRTSRSPTA